MDKCSFLLNEGKMNEDQVIDDALVKIKEACDLLGWSLAIPKTGDVTYLIVGVPEALDTVLDRLDRSVN